MVRINYRGPGGKEKGRSKVLQYPLSTQGKQGGILAPFGVISEKVSFFFFLKKKSGVLKKKQVCDPDFTKLFFLKQSTCMHVYWTLLEQYKHVLKRFAKRGETMVVQLHFSFSMFNIPYYIIFLLPNEGIHHTLKWPVS